MLAILYDLTLGGPAIAFGAKHPFFTNVDSTPKLYNLFHFFFLITIHTPLLSKTVPVFVNSSLIFINISYFV